MHTLRLCVDSTSVDDVSQLRRVYPTQVDHDE